MAEENVIEIPEKKPLDGSKPFYHHFKWRLLSYTAWNVLVVVFIVILVVIGLISTGDFLSEPFWRSVPRTLLPLALLVPATVMIMASGGLDLSAGALMTLTALLIARMSGNDMPIGLAILVMLLIGLGVGLFNGLVTGLARINGVIVTLAVGVLLGAIGNSILDVTMRPVSAPLFEGKLVPTLGWIIAALGIVITICLMQFTPFGRRPRAGDAGEREKWYLRALFEGLPYVLSSKMAVLAGVVLLYIVRSAQPGMGAPMQTNMILAALIGGSMLGGGFGSVFGAFLGAIAVSVINFWQIRMQIAGGMSPYTGYILLGVVFVLALLLSRLFHFVVDLIYRRRAAA